MIQRISLTLWLLLMIAGCAVAQPADMAGETLSFDTPVNDVLDALDLVGRDLKDFDAKVSMSEVDAGLGDKSTRTGRVWFQVLGQGDARVRVLLEKYTVGNKIKDEKLEYLLDKGWLFERNYKNSSEIRRQVVKPGQKINLLKLGEGPFPLPIGQKKEDVLAMFDVKKIKAEKSDPARTVHLELTPKKDSSFEKKFKTVDVWVDGRTHMPVRIATLDTNETSIRTTDLTEMRVNSGLKEDDFKLPVVEGWDTITEPYEE